MPVMSSFPAGAGFESCTLDAVVRINNSAALNPELIFNELIKTELKLGCPKEIHPLAGELVENYLDCRRGGSRCVCVWVCGTEIASLLSFFFAGFIAELWSDVASWVSCGV